MKPCARRYAAGLLLALVGLLGAVRAHAGDEFGTPSEVRVGGAVFRLGGPMHVQAATSPLDGDPRLTLGITAEQLGISFPPVLYGKRRRDWIYVTVKTGRHWAPWREAFAKSLREAPKRRSGDFDVYRVDPTTDLYLAIPPGRPDAIKCSPIGAPA